MESKKPNRKYKLKEHQPVRVGNSKRYILGSGSYGVVYSTNLKTAYKSFMMMELEWVREVVVTRYLSHPSIVQYHKVGVVLDNKFDLEKKRFQKKRIYTAQAQMKYFPAVLSELSEFTDSAILLIMNNISSAVSYLHDRNVLHRDIKEGNILVDVKDDVITKATLCDFGLGKFSVDADVRLEYEMITISHRPPELELSLAGDINQVLNSFGNSKSVSNPDDGKKNNYEMLFLYDHRVDVWSLCMVLVFMITGEQFYSYVNTKSLKFSSVLKDVDKFYKILNRFLGKYVNRKLKHLDFYMDLLRMGLNRYEDRPSMVDILRKINRYILTEKIQLPGDVYEAPQKITEESKSILVTRTSQVANNVHFCYRKKQNHDIMCKALKEGWKPLITDIDFQSVLTKERIENDAVHSATNNLYHTALKFKEKISQSINIMVSSGMIYAGCYLLTCVVLVDLYNEDPILENLISDSSIFQVMLRILALLDYNIIPIFQFVNAPEEKITLLVIDGKVPSPEPSTTVVDSLSLEDLTLPEKGIDS